MTGCIGECRMQSCERTDLPVPAEPVKIIFLCLVPTYYSSVLLRVGRIVLFDNIRI